MAYRTQQTVRVVKTGLKFMCPLSYYIRYWIKIKITLTLFNYSFRPNIKHFDKTAVDNKLQRSDMRLFIGQVSVPYSNTGKHFFLNTLCLKKTGPQLRFEITPTNCA